LARTWYRHGWIAAWCRSPLPRAEGLAMRIAALAVALTLTLAGVSVAAAEGIGNVSRIEGEAHATLDGSNIPLHPGTPIFEDEKLSTSAGGRLEVTFIDGTKV